MSDIQAQCPIGPIYGVELIDALEIDGGMRQAMPSASDLKGIRNYRQGQRVVAGYEVLLNNWREQGDEIARLQAIVDKLPKTADGVPVVPGMTLFTIMEDRGQFCVTQGVAWEFCQNRYGDTPSGWSIVFPREHRAVASDCYSTREAAEKATKEPNG